MMTIKFQTREEWYKGIAAMVREGLTFEACDHEGEWVITLSGGY
jgi:hypothetical protein